jgi:hypothetical protein
LEDSAVSPRGVKDRWDGKVGGGWLERRGFPQKLIQVSHRRNSKETVAGAGPSSSVGE